jgi:hypothetical protein
MIQAFPPKRGAAQGFIFTATIKTPTSAVQMLIG